MVYYKLVKITIVAPSLAKVIINVVVRYHGLSNLIITNWGSLFTLKFWSLLCYFFSIKRRLFNAFHPQMDGQTKRQNSMIEAYFWTFVNFEQNDWAWFFPMAELVYNNTKNGSTSHISFKLNCGYHPWISYKEDLDPRSKLKTAEELFSKLWNLMAVYQ